MKEKNNKTEFKVLKVIKKFADFEVKRYSDIWPPICCGFAYQPKRPIKSKDNSQNI